jgi:hypothetical protein
MNGSKCQSLRLVEKSVGAAVRRNKRTHSALKRSQHHMCSIQTMNKIGRECGSLLARVDYIPQVRFRTKSFARCFTFCGRIRVRDIHSLQCSHNLPPLRFPVRLDNRQPERCRPNNCSHLFFGQAIHNRLPALVFGLADHTSRCLSKTLRWN